MNKYLYLLCVCGVFLTVATPARAGVGQKLDSWFDAADYGNLTKPGVFKTQAARYATLGSMSLRSPIMGPLQLVNVQTPKISAGCGGIDIHTGGFSLITMEQFKKHLRAIGENAGSLAFMLGIQVVSPQLSGIMKDFQTWAQKFTKLTEDSCQAATAIVGGTMDLFGAQEGNCTVARMNEGSEDWATANYACTTGGKRKEMEEKGAAPNQIDFVKGNLAWYVLMQDSFFRNDTDIAQIMMNITGTIIVTDASDADDSPSDIRVIDAAVQDNTRNERFANIYNALLYGAQGASQIKIYRCDNPTTDKLGCMDVSFELQSVDTPHTGIHDRVSELVSSIAAKIDRDDGLTDKEKGMVASTSIPLFRFLSASTGVFPGASDLSAYSGELTKLIAEDILLRGLRSMVSNIKQTATTLPGLMSQSKRVKDYVKDLESVLRGISYMGDRNKELAEDLYAMRERIRLYEQTLMQQLGGRLVAALNWMP